MHATLKFFRPRQHSSPYTRVTHISLFSWCNTRGTNAWVASTRWFESHWSLALFTLGSILHLAKCAKQTSWSVFLGLEVAFESLDHGILRYSLPLKWMLEMYLYFSNLYMWTSGDLSPKRSCSSGSSPFTFFSYLPLKRQRKSLTSQVKVVALLFVRQQTIGRLIRGFCPVKWKPWWIAGFSRSSRWHCNYVWSAF